MKIVHSVNVDVTEGRNAEDALRASEARFRSLFHSSGIGTALVVEGIWVEVNEVLCRMLGRSQSELIGHSFLDCASGEDIEPHLSEVRRLLSGEKELHTFEHRFRHADGSTVSARVHMSRAWRPDSAIPSLIAQIENITDAKEAQLARAETLAKDRFLAGMSHELRNPLNAVLGFAELLECTGLDPLSDRQARFVRNIRASGQSLLDLVNDLLDFSKIQAGQMTAELGLVTVGETVDTVIERMSPIAEAKGVHLVAAGDARGALALADRRRLTQVLVNLVSNAIKFTPAQGQVTISCSLVAEGIQVAVTDTGIGIAPEEQSRIFSEFVQVDNEDTRSQAGTGLGLVLTMGLMTLMGGSIRVASLRGHGSTFTITLQSAPREDAILRVLVA